ncbi:MAG: copper chaperone PCu(A)C [Ignavibacteria bacterium]|nr:copper chaperone PCu(A)C [Ignavibacteria bacterium]
MKKLFLILLVTGIAVAQIGNKTQLSINDPWIRPAAQGANSAFFFQIENKGDKADTLIAAKFAHSEVVELHETFKKDNDMMGMRAVKSVAIPAKGTVVFKPRDLHIMLIGLTKDVKLGDTYELKLVFKKAGEIKTKAIVRDMPKMK